LCDLIEADIELAQSVVNGDDDDAVMAVQSRRKGKLVTYSDFLQHYWPHFSQSLTKGMSEWFHFLNNIP
jgi:hypothetical protein